MFDLLLAYALAVSAITLFSVQRLSTFRIAEHLTPAALPSAMAALLVPCAVSAWLMIFFRSRTKLRRRSDFTRLARRTMAGTAVGWFVVLALGVAAFRPREEFIAGLIGGYAFFLAYAVSLLVVFPGGITSLRALFNARHAPANSSGLADQAREAQGDEPA